MLSSVALPSLTLTGVSVGGVYTSIYVKEFDVIFDAGLCPRSFVGAKHLLISHGHADHIGALPGMIGMRGLAHLPAPQTYVPVEILEDVVSGIDAFHRGQHRKIEFFCAGLCPGEERPLAGDLWVRAFRTLHSVPSLGYLLFRRVKKLRPEFADMPREEIILRKQRHEDLFREEERHECAYVTDSRIDVLDDNPELYSVKTLILECTFLDDKRQVDATREKGHIHLDEILARAERFSCEHLVLMHFSQIYSPHEVRRILKDKLPPGLKERTFPLAPEKGHWPG